MTPEQILRFDATGEPWPAPLAAEIVDLPSAYRLALAVRALRIARGERPVGYKIGFTNRTIWPLYAVFVPVWGSMWNTTVAHCDGAGVVTLAHLCEPRIEPEAVFGFKATPPTGASLDDLFASLDWIAPGFEVVQSHMPGWKFTAAQTVADGGLHGRLLVGPKVRIADLASRADELDRMLAGARVRLSRDGAPVEEGTGANVLDSPLRALMHFLVELRSCPGATDVAPGDIVTTGTWTNAWPVQPGERWTSRYDAVLPGLEVRFD